MGKKFLSLLLVLSFILISLTGCSDDEKRIVGTWYVAGSDEIAFEFFEDGTCRVAYEYGTGTYVIMKDTLKITNYYGETKTIAIEEITDKKLILDSNGEKSYYFNFNAYTKDEEMEIRDNKELIYTNFAYGHIFEQGFSTFSTKINISDYGYFWVNAIDENGINCVVLVDSDLNVILALNNNNFEPISDFYEGVAVVFDKRKVENNDFLLRNEKIIIDMSGEDISSKYVNKSENEKIVGIFKDVTGVSIWTFKDIDTIDNHTTLLYAKDIEGNIKQQWKSGENFLINDSTLSRFEYVENAVYNFNGYVINVRNGHFFENPNFGDKLIGVDSENNLYYTSYYRNGVGKYSDNGTEIWRLNGNDCNHVGNFSEGLLYVLKENKNGGFIDKSGNYIIDLNKPASNSPSYKGEYAIVTFENDAGVDFVTLFDRNGKMMFNPIKGSAVSTNLSNYIENIIKIDNEYYILNGDGTTKSISLEQANGIALGNTLYYIENGQICTEQL